MKARWILLLLTLIPIHTEAIEPELKLAIIEDRDLFRMLPSKHLFENIEGKIFRSNDGTRVYLGPAPDRSFYILTGPGKVKKVEAPSTGKAYMNPKGEFVAWYDRIEDGIQVGKRLIPVKDPRAFRFGVSYDVDCYYLQEKKTARVFEFATPGRVLIQREQFYLYRIVRWKDRMFLLGFETLDTEEVRKSLCLEYAEINGVYQEKARTRIPDVLIQLDLDPYRRKLLLLNDSRAAPQLIEMDLASREMTNLGLIERFGIYLHPRFQPK